MSYKILGNYIRKVDNKNKDLKVLNLQGLSMNKEFRKSTSNIVGTDLSKYKIVKQGQFCCDFMSVIRVHKLPVVLNNLGEDVIISPAYIVFEIVDRNILLPEYLMMWFRRSEFDRYADFRCDSSIRGGFQWEELCEVELPIPSIEEQRKVVEQYKSVTNKIKVNEQICEKLEATAQALYKHWFVDFEFPISDTEAPLSDTEALEVSGVASSISATSGYKSSGGKMVWNQELEKEIPEGWENGTLEDFIQIKNGKVRPQNAGEIPVYGGNGIIDYVDKSNYSNINIIGRVGAYCGAVYFNKSSVWVSDNALAALSKFNTLYHNYLLLNFLNLNSRSEGSSHPLLTQGILNNIQVLKCKNEKIYIEFENIISPLYKDLTVIKLQNQELTQLQSLLLSRLATLEG